MKDPRQILDQLNELNRRHEQEKEAALRPAKERLLEIDRIREELDQEEAKLLELLRSLGAPGVPSGRKGPKRRVSGRRMTSRHKGEIIAEFIREGHIKNGTLMNKQLRTALADKGFGNHDFRKLADYMPPGWTAKSNGKRGNAAETFFQKN